ncbi:hypothetical protein Zmor_022018 [Zophobas morio]|uniref:Uncharacterized protein n=1 Tax=Zophobas morio TaxID=2755281 RepID=A0AA38I3H9_9CUCU|nr:hypothetical protein Zmor_022018 [Zophobas morio]
MHLDSIYIERSEDGCREDTTDAFESFPWRRDADDADAAATGPVPFGTRTPPPAGTDANSIIHRHLGRGGSQEAEGSPGKEWTYTFFG